MGNVFFFDWEPKLMAFLQSHMGSFGITFANICSMFGEETLMILIMGIFYWGVNKQAGIFMGINFCTTAVWNSMIKNVALRLRPYMVHDNVKILRPIDPSADIMDVSAQGYSFPSGHSSGSASMFGSIAVYFKKWWVTLICILIPFLCGCSRFCLGAHYPTDVLCGWLLAIVSIFLIPWLIKICKKKWIAYLIITAVCIPGLFYCKTNDYFTSFGILMGVFAGNLFEEKFVNFQETKNPLKVIIRVLLGGAIYFGLNILFKLPFPKEFLESASYGQYIFRVVRYFVIIFIDIGVYPMLFDKIKFGKKKAANA